MLRFSAFIAVLTLMGTIATAALAGQTQKDSSASCYNSQKCVAACNQTGNRMCELYCRRLASTRPPCK